MIREIIVLSIYQKCYSSSSPFSTPRFRHLRSLILSPLLHSACHFDHRLYIKISAGSDFTHQDSEGKNNKYNTCFE